MAGKNKVFAAGALLIALVVHPGAAGVSAAASPIRDNEADPLVFAKAVADRELFGRILPGDDAEPEIKVHHNLNWLDGTLMSGVAALYDKTEGQGSPIPRYLEYLEEWGKQTPGVPIPVVHGDLVCAGQAYLWLYERSSRTSDHLDKTDVMIDFLFAGRKFSQWGTGYHDYWMRFWNDDLHMVPPYLALRGRAVGSQGIPNGKDGRAIAMEYCRAYADILRDPKTGLFWHDRRTIGEYQWGRGNGWVAAGFTKVLAAIEDDPAYARDAAWLREQLKVMAKTLKDNRNLVGTWNADVLDRETYTAPETSGTAFFVFMIANMQNQGHLPEEYRGVALKAWNFLKRSVSQEGDLMRVQPVGGGPVKKDFETHSETYGVGGFLLAAIEMSRLPAPVLAQGDQVECIRLDKEELTVSNNMAAIPIKKLNSLRPDFPADPTARVQAVISGRRLPPTTVNLQEGVIEVHDPPLDLTGSIFLFYEP